MKSKLVTIFLFSTSLGAVQAQNVTNNLLPGTQYRINCEQGKLVENKTDKFVVYACQKISGGGPDPEPEPGPGPKCPEPTHGAITNPERLPELFSGERHYQISGTSTTIYRITKDRYSDARGHSQIGPHFGGGQVQSTLTTQTVTECPGVLDVKYVQAIDPGCFRSGQISTIKLQRGGNNDACNLKPGVPYFLNVSAYNPGTGRGTCPAGAKTCGIAHNVR